MRHHFTNDIKWLQSNIIISGTGRGGTSWIADLIFSLEKSALLFEPLHPERLPVWLRGWNRERHHCQYIPENQSWPQAEKFFQKILTGKWINEAAIALRESSLLKTDYFIIKFIHANRLLPWLVSTFPSLTSPIFIVRHPCAVVSSQLKHPFWRDVGNHFNAKKSMFSDKFYSPWLNILNSLKSREEVLAAEWCLDMEYLIRHPRNNKSWITVSYERLVIDPETELSQIFQRLGLDIPKTLLHKVCRPSRSTTTKQEHSFKNADKHMIAWKKRLSTEQAERILKVVDCFGLSDIYNEHPEPDYSSISAPGRGNALSVKNACKSNEI